MKIWMSADQKQFYAMALNQVADAGASPGIGSPALSVVRKLRPVDEDGYAELSKDDVETLLDVAPSSADGYYWLPAEKPYIPYGGTRERSRSYEGIDLSESEPRMIEELD